MNTKASVFLALCLSTHTAEAETALQVQSFCRGVAEAKSLADGSIQIPSDSNSSHCWGAFGAVQELIPLVDRGGGRLLSICGPEMATRTQLVKIFQKYVAEHPEEGHLSFGYVAQEALEKAFPCSSKSK
jgi:hypothetical protein